jgi:hypothetical protein
MQVLEIAQNGYGLFDPLQLQLGCRMAIPAVDRTKVALGY